MDTLNKGGRDWARQDRRSLPRSSPVKKAQLAARYILPRCCYSAVQFSSDGTLSLVMQCQPTLPVQIAARPVRLAIQMAIQSSAHRREFEVKIPVVVLCSSVRLELLPWPGQGLLAV